MSADLSPLVRVFRAMTGSRAVAVLFVALVACYAGLGLIVLAPEAVYSGDIGVKYVQARALWDQRFTSLDISYPAESLDPARKFFPMRPPFVMSVGPTTQAIFSPSSAVIQAVAVGIAGLRGLIALSVLAGAIVLYATVRLAPDGLEVPVLVAIGLGGPLWFYAVSGSEHALAVACGTAAYACAMRAPVSIAPVAAGLLIGAGAAFRDEVLLLLPGLLIVTWTAHRAVRPVLIAVAAALVPLAGAAAVEVWWFGRPAAAHLRHAVHLVQKAAHLTDAPNPDLPTLTPFTLRQRYETIVQYWLLGYGNNRVIAWFAAGLAAALVLRWRWRVSLGLLAWIAAIVVLAWMDLREVVTAPKWLAGLHRVSPYLAFAVLPQPAGRAAAWPWRRAMLGAAAAYLVVAAAAVDTTGGKSLGPRLLLPLFPLLTVTAVASIANYMRAEGFVDRTIGRAGALLVLMTLVVHLFGTIPAYRSRNQDDASAVVAVGTAPESIVLADDEFVAQLLLPLYFRKTILLVDTPELGREAARRMTDAQATGFIMVSRRPTAQISLRPFDLYRIEPAGRLSTQFWRQR
jgi:hypothetical protein